MYFVDPSTICTATPSTEMKLMLQSGAETETTTELPLIWGQWENVKKDKYVEDMGHHATPLTNYSTTQCTRNMPVQFLYAKDKNGTCHANGFLWAHYTNTKGVTVGNFMIHELMNVNTEDWWFGSWILTYVKDLLVDIFAAITSTDLERYVKHNENKKKKTIIFEDRSCMGVVKKCMTLKIRGYVLYTLQD